MYNTMIYGGYENTRQSIFSLADKNIIDVRCWMNFPYDDIKDKDYFIDMYSLFAERFLFLNKDKIEYYTSDIKFDQENYNIIFKKVFKFMEFYSSHCMWVDGYTHIYDAFYMFNSFYRFAYGIFHKEKIDIVLFVGFPHLGMDLIIYEIAKSLNIKTLIFTPLSIKPYTCFYMTDVNDFGTFEYMLSNEDNKNIDFINIEKKLKTPFYMSVPNIYDKFFNVKNLKTEIVKELLKFRKLNINTLRYLIVIYTETKNYRLSLKETSKQVNYDEKFVYFPLHLQPETTTSALGGIFTDQLLTIEVLSEIIPDDWKIVVKENPKQMHYMRNHTFFHKLKNIKKAILCPLDEDSFQLIEKCQFVATITGTAGFESLQLGKPVLTFGLAWYNFLPGVFKYNKNFNLDDLLNYKVDHSELEASYNKIIKKTIDVVLDYSCKDFILNFNETENNEKLASFIESQLQKLFKYNENRT